MVVIFEVTKIVQVTNCDVEVVVLLTCGVDYRWGVIIFAVCSKLKGMLAHLYEGAVLATFLKVLTSL